jgi:hypothetical protein
MGQVNAVAGHVRQVVAEHEYYQCNNVRDKPRQVAAVKR